MERVVPGAQAAARRRADLVGTPVFWLTIAVTLCALVPFALFPRMRAWLGCAVLLMWACFFTANAMRSRRTHSIISAPVYLLAAALLAGNALGIHRRRNLDGVGARRRHHRRESVGALHRQVLVACSCSRYMC